MATGSPAVNPRGPSEPVADPDAVVIEALIDVIAAKAGLGGMLLGRHHVPVIVDPVAQVDRPVEESVAPDIAKGRRRIALRGIGQRAAELAFEEKPRLRHVDM